MSKEATARSAISAERAMKLALEALGNSWTEPGNKQYEIEKEAITALREALAEQPAQPAQQEPVQDNPLDCGVHLGSGKDHAIKHHVSYGPAQPVPDAFEQLMREADKPTQVPESIAKYAAALVAGTHEITSLTIRPKRTWVHATEWRGLTDEEVQAAVYDENGCVVDYENYAEAIEAKLKEKNT